jgi:hypothetical protein
LLTYQAPMPEMVDRRPGPAWELLHFQRTSRRQAATAHLLSAAEGLLLSRSWRY